MDDYAVFKFALLERFKLGSQESKTRLPDLVCGNAASTDLCRDFR